MGQPYQGQPYPGPVQGQPYPGQQGYPQQGFPQGYQQPPFPGPAGPRKSRTGLIVLIVVLVVVVVGGGTTALVLLTGKGGDTSNASGPAGAPTPVSSSTPAPYRYQKVIANCTQLDGGPFTFIPKNPAMSQGQIVGGECAGSTQLNGEEVGVGVEFMIFNTANGVAAAAQSARQDGGQQVSGTGFENPPYVNFTGECMIDYSRSNEAIKLQFMGLPGVHDQASCNSIGMTYAQQYYKLIG